MPRRKRSSFDESRVIQVINQQRAHGAPAKDIVHQLNQVSGTQRGRAWNVGSYNSFVHGRKDNIVSVSTRDTRRRRGGQRSIPIATKSTKQESPINFHYESAIMFTGLILNDNSIDDGARIRILRDYFNSRSQLM